MDSRVDQSRYEGTQRQLQEIEFAVLGERNTHQPDGTIVANGFVSDLGRLPKALDDDGDGATPLQPQELWANPGALALFDLRQALAGNISSAQNIGTISAPALTAIAASTVADDTIRVPCGWRGPYLRLSPGVQNLKDGWGNPFFLLKADATDAVAGNEFIQIGTLGADALASGAGYDADVRLLFADANPAMPLDRYHGAISGTVDTDGFDAGAVSVRLYCPDPNTGKIACFEQSVNPGEPFFFPAVIGTTTVSSIGARIVRAVQTTASPVKKSKIKSVIVPAGGIDVGALKP